MRWAIWNWGRGRQVALLVVALLCLGLQACGSPPAPNLPSGVYTSQAYGFKVSYPTGWEANALTAQSSAPLILIITRSAARSAPASLVSTFTLDVLSLKDASIAKSAGLLATDTALAHITLAGQRAYRDTPITQATAGGGSVTHTDYYVIHGGYEYQISTDTVSGDAPAIQGIVNSFTLLG